MRLAQEMARFGIWDWDSRKDRQAWSPEQYAIHGIQPAAGPPSFAEWLDMVHEEDRPALIQAAQDGFGSADAGYRVVFQLRRASDGETRWILAFTRALAVDADGRPLQLLGVNIDVTEERELRVDLRPVTDLLQTIGACSPDAIFAKDRDGRMLFANPATLAAIGRSLDEVIGRTDLDWNPHREQALAAIANDRHVIGTGATLVVEEVDDAAGLARRVWSAAKAPLRDATGRISGVVGVAADITPLEDVEAALRTSEARLRALVDVSGPIIFYADATCRISSAHGSVEFTGLSVEDARNGGWLGPVHPKDTEAAADAWAEGQVDGNPLPRILSRAHGRGIAARGAAELDPHGRPLRFRGVNIDITGRKRAELALADSEARLRGLADALPDFVFMAFPDGRNVFTNGVFQDFLGLPAGVLLGDGWVSAVHPDDLGRATERWRRCVETGEPESLMSSSAAATAFCAGSSAVAFRIGMTQSVSCAGSPPAPMWTTCGARRRPAARPRSACGWPSRRRGGWSWNLRSRELDATQAAALSMNCPTACRSAGTVCCG